MMKIQGTGVSAPAASTSSSASVAQPASADVSARGLGSALPGLKDDFDRSKKPNIDIDALLGKLTKGLSFADRLTAADLPGKLSSPLNQVRLALGEKSVTLQTDKNGVVRGPDGQPLAEVKLKDGTTAYVDPNTNQYYLTDGKPDLFGRVKTLPAQDLPEGSKFSNKYFKDSDVQQVEQTARDGFPFPKLPDLPWKQPPVFPDLPKFPPVFPDLPKRDPIALGEALQGGKGQIKG